MPRVVVVRDPRGNLLPNILPVTVAERLIMAPAP
jgi:hypothetical protein